VNGQMLLRRSTSSPGTLGAGESFPKTNVVVLAHLYQEKTAVRRVARGKILGEGKKKRKRKSVRYFFSAAKTVKFTRKDHGRGRKKGLL